MAEVITTVGEADFKPNWTGYTSFLAAQRLKPHVKAAWLSALRSGEYEQGTGYLRNDDNQFCCLGVLCDIAAKDGIGEWDERPGDDVESDDAPAFSFKSRFTSAYGDEETADSAMPPLSVYDWAFESPSGDKPYTGAFSFVEVPDEDGRPYTRSIADMNDYDKLSFSAIADVIEEKW